MARRKKPTPSLTLTKLKASGAGMARATKGRKTTFTDRKRKANKEACRRQHDDS